MTTDTQRAPRKARGGLGRWAAAAAAGLLLACGPYQATAPEGFATYDGCGADSERFRAASADGVLYTVRLEDNEPAAALPFWKEALKKRMLDSGYAFVAESAIESGGQPGYLLDLAAPVGPQDYAYLVAIFVTRDGQELLIAEAAGEVGRLAAHRPALGAAIAALRP